MKTRVRAPALRRANPKAPLVPASVKKPARKAVSTIRRKTTKNAPKQMKAADRRRIIHSRTKTLMRHCGVGHRRGAFGDKSYRDRVGAVLQSVYGNTFKEGSWWYQNPDAGLFFAKVFSAATGFKTNVTPTQAEAVFVKNEGTKKMFVCERAMLQAGFTVAQVTSLYEQTPAAAWNADDDVSERFIQVQVPVAKTKPLVSLAAAAACPSSAVKSVPTSLGSSRYSPVNTQIQRNIDHQIQRGITCSSASGSARWVPSSEDDDDDDATVVADEFNDEVEAFLSDESDDAIAYDPAPGGLGEDEIPIPGYALDFPLSQPLAGDFAGGASQDFLKHFLKDVDDSPAKRRSVCPETLNQNNTHAVCALPANGNHAAETYDKHSRDVFHNKHTLGAVRKNMSFLGATAATASDAARFELEQHLAAVDKILREQTDFHDLLPSFFLLSQ
jgi:hypothetical protein|eukprot:CAMPEP_0119212724 /NCGR_PEP_ID=MMETSP1327-20130426/4930_1 /TAXON_ID=38833 /ORGANISM="Micromonas pusilla, Strain RCC2306" /LENGTH=442 /DNA_ID=CAMNT_0007210129 /DNA_START=98 /DNA_END=1426 /DNA_ORIENTATION=-